MSRSLLIVGSRVSSPSCLRHKMLDGLGLVHGEVLKCRQLKKSELVAKIATFNAERKRSYSKWWQTHRAQPSTSGDAADAKQQRLQ